LFGRFAEAKVISVLRAASGSDELGGFDCRAKRGPKIGDSKTT
jgi:hypothetical protein